MCGQGEEPSVSCDGSRSSSMKLIHPTALVSTPIAMQSMDVVEYVPATIQAKPAATIMRETRSASALSVMAH
jgi:hypothetical protein